MKIDNNIKSDKIEIVKQTQAKTEEKFIRTFRPYYGHKMFEINKKTGDVQEAEFETRELSFEKALKGDVSDRKKIVMKPDCVYVSALNIKNAMKKLGIKVKINKK